MSSCAFFYEDTNPHGTLDKSSNSNTIDQNKLKGASNKIVEEDNTSYSEINDKERNS